MDAALLTALAEPNRLRIVELLNEHPSSVGEIADTLGLRQPQVTKHLHTLARAGVVSAHPLGQRRIYALEREPLEAFRQWLDAFGARNGSEDVIEQYRRAVDGPVVRLSRELPAPPSVLWPYWTSAPLMSEWFAPEHFTVAHCEVDPVAGGRLRVVMEEADGSRHAAAGRFLRLDAPRGLSFEMAPLGRDGRPRLRATYAVAMKERGDRTDLSLDVRLASSAGDAAGMRLGWEQCMTKLAQAIAADARSS